MAVVHPHGGLRARVGYTPLEPCVAIETTGAVVAPGAVASMTQPGKARAEACDRAEAE
jgi:hypothetical protein